MKINMPVILTAASIILNIFSPFAAADGGYIYISDSADITELANHCMIDSYSTGKTVVLKQDIDLSGVEFDSIAYFNGTFDGAGYTVSGLDMVFTDPERGFIGIIGENGTVKNLNINGNIKTKTIDKTNDKLKIIDNIASEISTSAERFVSDDAIYTVGGLCGINKGHIINCSFEGSVAASKSVGGICGINENTIESSRNKGSVVGDSNVGGISGRNSGVIKWSENTGTINDTANETASCVGGIAGKSSGVLNQCKNNGIIGYKNTGSNVGGIVGTQSGLVTECENKAQVFGKNEVGGICGRFEPFINIDFNKDQLGEKIDEQKAQLKKDLESLQSDVDSRAQQIRDNYNSLKNGLFPALGSAATESILGSFLGNSGGLSSLNDNIKTVTDSIAAMNGILGNSLSGVSDNFGNAVGDISGDLGSGIDSLKNFSAGAENAVSRIADSADSLSENLNKSNDNLISLVDEIEASISSGTGNREELAKSLRNKIDQLDTELNLNMDPTIDVGGIVMEGIDLSETDYRLSRAISDLSELLGDEIGDMFEPFQKISSSLNEIIQKIENRKKMIEDLKKKLEDMLKELETSPTAAPTSTPNETDTNSTELPLVTQEPKEKSALKIFSKIFLPTTVYAETGSSDKSTLQKLAELDIHDMDIPVTRQIAGAEYDSALIKYCVNSGHINGMSDVGGIAGTVGFETILDDSINKNGTVTFNPSTAVKAVISACINEGKISAKNTSAGGISGFSDLGSIKESINTGNIEVTDGSYSGGISGYHMNNITRCISIGDLAGMSDVGGIAGKGTNIEGSYALARTDSTGERCGAIAGSTGGNIKYNYFLKESMGGINGVDYQEKAQGVSKEILAKDGGIAAELKGIDDKNFVPSYGDLYMPQLKAFTENAAEGIADKLKAKSADAALFKFKASFVIDGKEVKSVKLNYGDKIPEKEIPVLEKRSGEYGVWDKDTSQEIVRNTVFNAVYNNSTLTLSYGGEPPLILTEGNFSPNAILEVNELDAKVMSRDNTYEPHSRYSINISEDGKIYDDIITVRIKNDSSKNVQIGVIENGAIVVTDSERDGSYIKFDMKGQGEFIVLYKKNTLIHTIMAAAALIFLVLLVITLIRKNKKSENKHADKLIDAKKEPELLESGK